MWVSDDDLKGVLCEIRRVRHVIFGVPNPEFEMDCLVRSVDRSVSDGESFAQVVFFVAVWLSPRRDEIRDARGDRQRYAR